MPLMNHTQIVLQYPSANGASCVAFGGAPIDAPIYICVQPASPSAMAIAEQLGIAIARELTLLGSSVQVAAAPCGGGNFGSCHAFGVPECRKFLVPVFADAQSAAVYALPVQWKKHTDLCVIPALANGVAPALLSPALSGLNAVSWQIGDRSAVHRVLIAVGLTSQRPRLFLSYVRRESAAVAEQLFDRLGQLGFRVFLDRISVPPGADLAAALLESLSTMGAVLFLESSSINRSPWTRYETNFARCHRLGLAAVRLPRGRAIAGIDDGRRFPVERLTQTRRIPERTLRKLCEWIVPIHASEEQRRSEYLVSVLCDALLLRGVRLQTRIAPNVLLVENAHGQRFSVRVSNVPAELDDFQRADQHRPPAVSSHVLAPGKFVDWRRTVPLEWLQSVSSVSLSDEGEIDDLARRLA